MSPSAAPPPSPQEVQRKLSVHSKPKKVTPPPTTPVLSQSHVSGTESDSDSILSPDLASPTSYSLASSGVLLSGSCSQQPPLSSIAERRSASGGEESEEDDEDEEGWRSADRSGAVLNPMDESAIKSGYLWKKGERRKNWKKRWFVLRPAHLAYYKTSAEYKPLRLLDLSDVHSCTPVVLKKHTYTFGVVSAVRTFYLQAQSPEEVHDWVKAIQDARDAHMMTSTQTTLATPPIPIPRGQRASERQVVVTPSPPRPVHVQNVTSSDSEDGSPYAQRILSTSPQHVTIATENPSRSKVVLSGYLMKCGSKRHNWRKRWFRLSSEKLDTKPHRQFSVSDILDALEFDIRSHKHGAGVSPPVNVPGPSTSSADKQASVEGPHMFKIEEEIKWLSAIRALIARRTEAGVVPGSGGEKGEGGLRHKVRNLSISGPSGGGSATEER
ncbi:PH-domain-containing protein [Pisolithus croceorrhizus]|nr:PH-domain-containing protein [Pisolithus croceorrhizus]